MTFGRLSWDVGFKKPKTKLLHLTTTARYCERTSYILSKSISTLNFLEEPTVGGGGFLKQIFGLDKDGLVNIWNLTHLGKRENRFGKKLEHSSSKLLSNRNSLISTSSQFSNLKNLKVKKDT